MHSRCQNARDKMGLHISCIIRLFKISACYYRTQIHCEIDERKRETDREFIRNNRLKQMYYFNSVSRWAKASHCDITESRSSPQTVK